MPEMKTLNGYEVVDAKAREDIEALKNAGHATEEYVDNAIAAIPEVDLSEHALKSEIPTKVSQLENDSKYITREEVPETDLSEYAKKSEIPDVSDFITNIPDEYITESELNAKGYLTEHQDISGKADKEHYHSQYLTEHQSLAGYATETFVTTKIAEAQLSGEGGQIDLSGYATKDDLANINECDTYFFDPRELVFDVGINSTAARLSDHMTEFTTRLIAGESVNLIIYEETLSRYLPAEFVVNVDGGGQKFITFQRAISASDIFNEAVNTRWTTGFSNSANCFVVTRDDGDIYRIASVTYVDDAIAKAIAALRAELTGGN